jgi:hypothetical protein
LSHRIGKRINSRRLKIKARYAVIRQERKNIF